MPATTTRRATAAQLNFLRTLVSERTEQDLRDAHVLPEIREAIDGHGYIARDLIDRVIAVPRQGRSGSAAPAARQDGEPVEAPSTGTRAGRMLLAGGIEATTTLADGRHVTVQIRTRKRSGRGWTNAALGEADSRTSISILGRKVGWLNVDASGQIRMTLRTRREEYRTAILAIFEYAATGTTAGQEQVREASRCGRCFRTLTDPVSIDRGIGPECFGRDTGSQHVAAERRAAGSDVLPEPTTRPSLVDLAREADRRAAGVEHPEVVEARMHAQFAAAERAAENAAYEAEMEQERQMAALETVADALTIPQATTRRVDSSATDVARARDLIAEALDSYFGEPELSFALGIFDQLAGR